MIVNCDMNHLLQCGITVCDQRIFMLVEIQSSVKWTSLECSVHADHNGTNPGFIQFCICYIATCM